MTRAELEAAMYDKYDTFQGKSMVADPHARIAAMAAPAWAEIERLRDALHFYGAQGNYFNAEMPDGNGYFPSLIDKDKGKRVREVLP